MKQYKLRGGINWCDCNVIAEFREQVWIHNLDRDSTPVYHKRDVEFRDKPKKIRDNIYHG